MLLLSAKLLQSCPTLCDPIEGSSPGSPVPGILQARTLEWVAISFSNAWKWEVKMKSFSRVRLLVTPRTAAYQPPPSMRFSRQEFWSGVPLPSPISYASYRQYSGPRVHFQGKFIELYLKSSSITGPDPMHQCCSYLNKMQIDPTSLFNPPS